MTPPKHAGQDWDRRSDEQDALKSLDSADFSSALTQVIADEEDPLTTVLPRENDIKTTRLADEHKTVGAPQQTVEQPILRRTSQRRRVSSGDSRILYRDSQYRRDARDNSGKTRQAARVAQPAVQSTVQPVPSQPYDEKDIGATATRRPARERRARHVPFFVTVVMVAARLAAIALCVLIVLLAVPQMGIRLKLMELTTLISSSLPNALSGILVIPSPFGGAFRGDFAIAALILFIIDWLCSFARASSR